MATDSRILALRISWMEEPGGLQSRGAESDTNEQPGTQLVARTQLIQTKMVRSLPTQWT